MHKMAIYPKPGVPSSVTPLLFFPDAPDDIGGRAAPFLLGRRDGVPGEHQAPVEASDLRLGGVPQVLEGVPVDHVDDGAHHGRGRLFDSAAGRQYFLSRITKNYAKVFGKIKGCIHPPIFHSRFFPGRLHIWKNR